MTENVSSVVWSGQTYGRWSVVAYSHRDGAKWFWLCRCECGTERPVYSASLRNGRSKSCGCLKREVQATLQTKHGGHKSPEYCVWECMISRCHNPNRGSYSDYGARGIVVCARWRESFADFLEDMGPRPSRSHSLDRVDNDLGYEPGNCRWATQSEQNRNKRNNHLITHDGLTLTIAGWAERTGLSFSTLKFRVTNGWSTQDALTTPADRCNARRYKDPNRKALTLTMNGETCTVAEWARRTGFASGTISARKRYGWSDEKTLTTPVMD